MRERERKRSDHGSGRERERYTALHENKVSDRCVSRCLSRRFIIPLYPFNSQQRVDIVASLYDVMTTAAPMIVIH